MYYLIITNPLGEPSVKAFFPCYLPVLRQCVLSNETQPCTTRAKKLKSNLHHHIYGETLCRGAMVNSIVSKCILKSKIRIHKRSAALRHETRKISKLD